MATMNQVGVGLSGSSGTGAFAGNVSPSFTTPALGAATGASVVLTGKASGNNFIPGFATTATAAATTTLVVSSAQVQEFTGSTTQTVVMPVTSTLVAGQQYYVINNSSGVVTVQSSGANTIQAMAPSTSLFLTCVSTSGTTAASWESSYISDTGLAGAVLLAPSAAQTILTYPLNLPGSVYAPSVLDSNGATMLAFSTVGSAVNYGRLYNNASGSSPALVSDGADTDIGWVFATKAAGSYTFNTNALTNQFTMQTGAGYQHVTNWAYPTSSANRTITIPDSTGTMGLYTSGSFTPVLVSTGGGTATYGIQTGAYSIIAGVLFFNLSITISANSFGAGTLTITGLPNNASQNSPVVIYANQFGATATGEIMGLIGSGGAAINLFTFALGTTSNMTVAQLTAASQFFISGSYIL